MVRSSTAKGDYVFGLGKRHHPEIVIERRGKALEAVSERRDEMIS
jgi:hypothetical protein